jgi:hypothetical protein
LLFGSVGMRLMTSPSLHKAKITIESLSTFDEVYRNPTAQNRASDHEFFHFSDWRCKIATSNSYRRKADAAHNECECVSKGFEWDSRNGTMLR